MTLRRAIKTLLSAAVMTLLAACGEGQNTTALGPLASFSGEAQAKPERWYSVVQVRQGDRLFQANCAECHGVDASGSSDWRTMDESGKYPPPPLNGTAHTWHHPLSILRRTVRMGGVPLGGSMPGFADKLSEGEIDAILAWVQSQWPDEVYAAWNENNLRANR